VASLYVGSRLTPDSAHARLIQPRK